MRSKKNADLQSAEKPLTREDVEQAPEAVRAHLAAVGKPISKITRRDWFEIACAVERGQVPIPLAKRRRVGRPTADCGNLVAVVEHALSSAQSSERATLLTMYRAQAEFERKNLTEASKKELREAGVELLCDLRDDKLRKKADRMAKIFNRAKNAAR